MFYLAVILFLVAYAIIVSERIHRTAVALAGGVLMVLLGILNQEEAFEAIDFNTIGLLIGMMIIVLITKKTGLFEYVAIRSAKLAKGEPVLIFIFFAVITAVFSALLDNVTTILLIAPVTFVIANNLRMNPLPLLITEIIMSNIGGTATLIGDPPNILIGSAAGLTFLDFVINLGPLILILTPFVLFFLYLIYRKHLHTTKERQQSIMAFDTSTSIKDKKLLIKSLIALGLTIVGFLVHGFLHLEPATVALFGAALLLVISDIHPEEILKELEWTTILFFAGLFVLVAGIEHVGFIDVLAQQLLNVTQGSPNAMIFSILWGSAIFSAFIDNIPFVATMIPLVHELGESGVNTQLLWWVLAIGADMGGNGTLVGASANLVGAGIAEKAGYKLTFRDFFKIGFSVMIITMVLSSAYIWIRYLF
ncbi:MAG: ArsB/NhaD family transporter [Candidatus Kerfeldbacteria bacterium]